VLVSAAAGSGKTAVLVERIISMITDPDKNIDIDRLVVVTFTKAAAAQMKDKIRKALDSMLDENPGDVNLLRQIKMDVQFLTTKLEEWNISQLGLEPAQVTVILLIPTLRMNRNK